MIRRLIFALLLLLWLMPLGLHAQYTVSGYVFDKSDREALPGANVVISGTQKGTATNAYGFYSLTVDEKAPTLQVTYIGYQTVLREVDAADTAFVNFYLEERGIEAGKEIVVTAERQELQEQVNSAQMGMIDIEPKSVAQIPTIAGESDLIKVAQLLPGVSGGSEGSTGMYVRGGTQDQNMVILDEASVYNIGHLFGFFSIFNTDAIKNIDMIKGGFPVRYGGRLSSIVDVQMKEGSLDRYKAKGGVGLLTSRLTVEGPILEDKSSFMVAGRRTYIDKVFQVAGGELPYYFYDLNGKVNYRISDRDRLYFSAYFGNDVLAFDEQVEADSTSEDELTGDLNFGFELGNFTTTFRWNHIYPGQKLFSNITIHQTNFNYDIQGEFVDNSVLITSKIQDFGIRGDWEYYWDQDKTLSFGAQSILHLFRPNVISTKGIISDVLASQEGERIATTEWAFFGGMDQEFSARWRANYGLRLSFSQWEQSFYGGLEPRLSSRYKLTESASLKASYSLMRQYMHRVSSSSIALPTDLWYPVSGGVEPQLSHLLSAGYTHIFPAWSGEITVEGYYKEMDNLIEYREGANLVLNDNFEKELLAGSGDSYGLELLIRKREGVVTGWLSYSLSKSTRHFDELNEGARYPAKYDRRHSLSLVSMIELSPTVTFSAVWNYMSGARFTAQTGQYLMPNASLTDVELIPVYSDRNAVELSPTHRLDLSFVVRSAEKDSYRSEWQFGVYNFYNRASPFRVSIQHNGVHYRYVQEGLFGFIPSISYNFNFISNND